MTEREAMLLWAKMNGKGKIICTAYGIETDMTPNAIENNCIYIPHQKEYAPVTIDKLFALLIEGKPVQMRKKPSVNIYSWEPVNITEPVMLLIKNAKNLEFRVEVDG